MHCAGRVGEGARDGGAQKPWWSRYANALRNDPPSGIWKLAPAEREAVGITEEGHGRGGGGGGGGAGGRAGGGQRARAAAGRRGARGKAPESYDASKTSTEYTRELA